MKMNATISNGLFLLILGTSMVGKSEPLSKKNYSSLQLRSPPPKKSNNNNSSSSSNKNLSQQKRSPSPKTFDSPMFFVWRQIGTQLMANWWFGIPGSLYERKCVTSGQTTHLTWCLWKGDIQILAVNGKYHPVTLAWTFGKILWVFTALPLYTLDVTPSQ